MIYIINESQKDFILQNMIGERVMVYYNLHKHTFSIQKSGIVITHADFVRLTDVEFRVREGGKEKVRQEKRKNVHAFVIGNLEEFCKYPCDEIPEEPVAPIITYDPYQYDSFIIKTTNEPIFYANEVEMINSRNKIFLIE